MRTCANCEQVATRRYEYWDHAQCDLPRRAVLVLPCCDSDRCLDVLAKGQHPAHYQCMGRLIDDVRPGYNPAFAGNTPSWFAEARKNWRPRVVTEAPDSE